MGSEHVEKRCEACGFFVPIDPAAPHLCQNTLCPRHYPKRIDWKARAEAAESRVEELGACEVSMRALWQTAKEAGIVQEDGDSICGGIRALKSRVEELTRERDYWKGVAEVDTLLPLRKDLEVTRSQLEEARRVGQLAGASLARWVERALDAEAQVEALRGALTKSAMLDEGVCFCDQVYEGHCSRCKVRQACADALASLPQRAPNEKFGHNSSQGDELSKGASQGGELPGAGGKEPSE